MSGSSQSTNVIKGTLNLSLVKAALILLGWTADKSTQNMLIAHDGYSFSAFVSWQQQNGQTIANIRVLDITSRQAQALCDERLGQILSALAEIKLQDIV